jgi:GT2 family glycosyltransferase
MLAKKFPTVKTILNSENAGFGKANNQAIAKAEGDYVLLLNSDTIVLNNAIGKLVSFGKQHPNAFIGAKLLNVDRSAQTSCGPFLSLPVVFTALFLKGDVLGITRWSPNHVRKVDWISGACILGPRKLFKNGLLFDEKIFMYMEEIDLLYRAKKKGISVFFYPRSLIVHLGGGSSSNKRKGPVLQIYRGLLYFYQKHHSAAAVGVLRLMLRAKALISWLVGVIVGNRYLKETYAEAYKLV